MRVAPILQRLTSGVKMNYACFARALLLGQRGSVLGIRTGRQSIYCIRPRRTTAGGATTWAAFSYFFL